MFIRLLPKFDLPDFSIKKPVTATAIGSSVHELMQRLELSDEIRIEDLVSALNQVSADDEVKACIKLDKIFLFFKETLLGQLIQEQFDKVHREAPFAMLKEDIESKEYFVVRGIIDGYILLDDRIVLFDYKTNKFTSSQDIKQRYQGQMTLYAEALSKSYQIKRIDKYLILLGGDQVEVVEV